MPPRKREQDFEIRYDDYVHFVCVKCDQSAKVTYLGLDPTIPRIKVVCEECGKSDVWKIWNADIISFPSVRR